MANYETAFMRRVVKSFLTVDGGAKLLAVTFVVPVFAMLYGVLFLGEAVTLWMLLCAVVIVCGTALSTGLLKIGR